MKFNFIDLLTTESLWSNMLTSKCACTLKSEVEKKAERRQKIIDDKLLTNTNYIILNTIPLKNKKSNKTLTSIWFRFGTDLYKLFYFKLPLGKERMDETKNRSVHRPLTARLLLLSSIGIFLNILLMSTKWFRKYSIFGFWIEKKKIKLNKNANGWMQIYN